jgi:hypothetical protein
MSKNKGLFTFDEDNHRYVPIAQADGVIDCMDYEQSEPTEPLIKDEKIRKAVRAWAEANDIERVWHEYSSCWLRGNGLKIELENEVVDLEQKNYTIAELCGEVEE